MPTCAGKVSTFKCDRAVDIDFNFSLTVDAAGSHESVLARRVHEFFESYTVLHDKLSNSAEILHTVPPNQQN